MFRFLLLQRHLYFVQKNPSLRSECVDFMHEIYKINFYDHYSVCGPTLVAGGILFR